MQTTRPLLAAFLIFIISGCGQTPESLDVPTLEPQLGPPETLHAVGVAFNKAGQLYSLTESYTHSWGDESNDESWTQQALLYRYDRNGNLLWEREVASTYCNITHYPECSDIEALDVAVDGDGNSYALIHHYYESCDHAAEYSSSSVTKLNRAGTRVWSTDVASTSDFFVDTSGNFYVVGNNDTGYNYCDEDIDNDPPFAQIVRKYDANINLLWERKLNVGTPTDVTVFGNGSVYVVGDTGISRYSSSGSLVWTKPGAATEVIVSGSSLYTRTGTTLRRLDGSGKQLWSKSVAGLSSAEPLRSAGDSAGNLYVAGAYTTSSRGRDAFVRKYSGSGSLVWSKGFGTNASDNARGVASDGSEVYVVGEAPDWLAGTKSSGYLRKMDGNGNRIWAR